MSLWRRDSGALLSGRLKNWEETPSVWPRDLDSSPPLPPKMFNRIEGATVAARCRAGSSGRVWGPEPDPAVGRPGPEGVSAADGTGLDMQKHLPLRGVCRAQCPTPPHTLLPPKPLSQSAPSTSRASLVPLALMILILCPLHPWNVLPFPNSKEELKLLPRPVTSRFQ